MNRCYYWFVLLVLAACTRVTEPEPVSICLRLPTPSVPTRASDPEEDLISDYNLLIFNDMGVLEEATYVSARELSAPGGELTHRTKLLQDASYWVLAAANLGYRISFDHLEQALAYRYHMAYSDEYSRGIPMAACLHTTIGDTGRLEVPLQRLMARIEVALDRSALDPEVSMNATLLKLGGCPSSAFLFAPNRVETAAQLFGSGFIRSGQEVNNLNLDVSLGLSGTVPLYLLENLQGQDATGRQLTLCAYLELRLEYHSPQWHTRPGRTIGYRLYLGDGFDVHRNTCYRYVICPVGDGLNAPDDWTLDREALLPTE